MHGNNPSKSRAGRPFRFQNIQVYVDNIVYSSNSSLPTTGEIVVIYQTGSAPINFVPSEDGNIGGIMPLSTTMTLRSGQFTLFRYTASEWNVFS